jgi:hypothetical protein
VLKGKTLDEILDCHNPLEFLLLSIQSEIGVVPEENWHCPPTAIQALLIAFTDYFQRNNDEQRLKQIAALLKEIHCIFESRIREQ